MFYCISVFYADRLSISELKFGQIWKKHERLIYGKKINIMKHQLKNINEEIMEFGDHLKNGVNLQNLSSRRNLKHSYYAYFA
jgi:hypothetical protein